MFATFVYTNWMGLSWVHDLDESQSMNFEHLFVTTTKHAASCFFAIFPCYFSALDFVFLLNFIP